MMSHDVLRGACHYSANVSSLPVWCLPTYKLVIRYYTGSGATSNHHVCTHVLTGDHPKCTTNHFRNPRRLKSQNERFFNQETKHSFINPQPTHQAHFWDQPPTPTLVNLSPTPTTNHCPSKHGRSLRLLTSGLLATNTPGFRPSIPVVHAVRPVRS